jgi:outer membrane autotransporter protein
VEKHFGGALPLNGNGLSMSLMGEDRRQERAGQIGRSGYRWDGRAFGMAFDQTIGSGVSVGLAGSHTTGDFKVSAELGSGEAQATSVSAFVGYKAGPFSGNVQLGRSWLDFEMERATGFTPALQAQSKTNGKATFVDGSARYDVALGPLTLAPSAGLRWTRISVDGWQESSGGLMNARAERQKRSSLIASAGSRAELSVPAGPLVIRPYASAHYERELMDGEWTSAVVLGSGQRFALEAEPGDRKWVALEGGLTATLDERLAASLSYRTRVARSGDEERTYSAGLKYRF